MLPEEWKPSRAFEEVGSQQQRDVGNFCQSFFRKAHGKLVRRIGDDALNIIDRLCFQIVSTRHAVRKSVVSEVRREDFEPSRPEGTNDCTVSCGWFPYASWKIIALDVNQAYHSLRRTKVSIEAAIGVMVAALYSQALVPLSNSGISLHLEQM
jgi:hypothetical protein